MCFIHDTTFSIQADKFIRTELVGNCDFLDARVLKTVLPRRLFTEICNTTTCF